MAPETMRDDVPPVTIPLHAEEVTVAKRRINTGRARVSIVTRQEESVVEELLARERVEIERRPVGKAVAHAPAVREEGGTLIIPVVEEVLVAERRLILKEEIRIRRIRETERHRERVKVRRQEAILARLPAHEEAAAETTAPVESQTVKKEK